MVYGYGDVNFHELLLKLTWSELSMLKKYIQPVLFPRNASE